MNFNEPKPASQVDRSNPSANAMKGPSGPWVWVRTGLVLALIAGSGGVRLFQMRRVDAKLASGRESPFPLSTIPMTLGSWVGKTTAMDPKIVEATGSTDQVTRQYIDQRTGVALDVIVLYGPTSDIFIHSPELCYPKAGYAVAGDMFEKSIKAKGATAPFRSLAYSKGETGQVELQEVFYAWRYNGRWSTAVSSPKESERIPGMYKVQIARRLLPNESRTTDNPCEAFLEVLIPNLESRITAQAPAARKGDPETQTRG